MGTKTDEMLAVILTHGRPDGVKTFDTLRRCGFTGRIVLLLDDEDDFADAYREKYGSADVFTFCKVDEMAKCDQMDNFARHGVILYARNAAYDLAEKLGYRKFIELDDDYTHFNYRWIGDGKLHGLVVKRLDAVFQAYFDFAESSGARIVAMAQGGDFIGGADGSFRNGYKRKVMNVLFCDTSRRVRFFGSINEDVNSYTVGGIRGELFITVYAVSMMQTVTQKSSGGMSGTYAENGTYIKSFYSVIAAPSCVKIHEIGGSGHGYTYKRIHHTVKWEKCAVKIVSGKWRKG